MGVAIISTNNDPNHVSYGMRLDTITFLASRASAELSFPVTATTWYCLLRIPISVFLTNRIVFSPRLAGE